MDDRERVEWDEHWASVSSTVSSRDVYYILDEIKLSYLKPLMPPVGRSLEVGCGSARLSRFLARDGYATYGLDYSRAALTVAQENYQLANTQGHLVEGNGLDLPFANGCFDIVLSTGLLEHFVDPSPIIGEMVRVLRHGGIFYSDIVPDKFSLLRLLDGLRRTKNVFERGFDRAEVRSLLLEAGLTDVVVFPAGIAPPLWIPLLYQWKGYIAVHTRLTMALKPWLVGLDNTPVAERLGFYYFCVGRKGSPEKHG